MTKRMIKQSMMVLLPLLGLGAGAAIAETAGEVVSEEAPASPVYEMRTYTTNDGKFDALLTRFSDHTMALFEKHGMGNVAYWIPLDQPDTLIYVLAHRSRAAAADSWKAFSADPQWQAVYQASIADGRLVNNIVSVFMVKTDFSP